MCGAVGLGLCDGAFGVWVSEGNRRGLVGANEELILPDTATLHYVANAVLKSALNRWENVGESAT